MITFLATCSSANFSSYKNFRDHRACNLLWCFFWCYLIWNVLNWIYLSDHLNYMWYKYKFFCIHGTWNFSLCSRYKDYLAIWGHPADIVIEFLRKLLYPIVHSWIELPIVAFKSSIWIFITITCLIGYKQSFLLFTDIVFINKAHFGTRKKFKSIYIL